MAERVAILCFTGTGNTEAVARLLGSALAGAGCAVERFAIEDILRGRRLSTLPATTSSAWGTRATASTCPASSWISRG